jgi:hypothetical protein
MKNYDKWLDEEIQKSIDDPRPSVPHEKVMKDMREFISQMRKKINNDKQPKTT